MDLPYRLRQFRALLVARPLDAARWREIEALLSPAELALFRRFSPGDRQHSYRVMRALREAGHDDERLLAAALLHDVGKTRLRLHLWERISGALVETFAPSLGAHWGAGPARSWRRPFVIRAQHAEWGAEMAEAAGSDLATAALIRHHQQKPPDTGDDELDRLLGYLQWADNLH